MSQLCLYAISADSGRGYVCFRAYCKGSFLENDPLCASFGERECENIWIGQDVRLVKNTLRDEDEFNWIHTNKDNTNIAES